MKLVPIGTSLALLLKSSNALNLNSECTPDDNLLITIPLQDERMANVLRLSAGTCTHENIPGGVDSAISYNSLMQEATVTIPIEDCGMRGDLYPDPLTVRSAQFYKPTANITLGANHDGIDIIFKQLHIGAECGMRTSYEVDFAYNVEADSTDDDGCQMIDGVCVFPAWHEDARFEILEYTDSSYAELANHGDDYKRRPGEPIYFEISAENVPRGYEHAVTSCSVVSATGTEVNLVTPADDETCSLDEIDLVASYVNGQFRMSHIVFLTDSPRQSSYTMKCSIELCRQGDPDSVCTKAGNACGGGICPGNDYEFVNRNGYGVFTFTSCGEEGYTGPSVDSCRQAYSVGWTADDSHYSNENGIQIWTVPSDGVYEIEAIGATSSNEGDDGNYVGKPAKMQGLFSLTRGTKLKILVGQTGVPFFWGDVVRPGFGGGGGTFVADLNDVPLIVAGGCGSGHYSQYNDGEGLGGEYLWQDANPVHNGPGYNVRQDDADFTPHLLVNQDIGYGGQTSDSEHSSTHAGEGAGFLGDGHGGTYYTSRGYRAYAFINGGEGHQSGGGFGGGGGGGTTHGGGAGGYSGGMGALGTPWAGGGAGSYNVGDSQVNELAAYDGRTMHQGSVSIAKRSCYLG